MKKLFLSATAIATVMSATSIATVMSAAADLPSIKSAPATPAPMWTGFYAGMNAGYGFGVNSSANANSNALNDPFEAQIQPPYAEASNYQSSFYGPGMALSGSSIMQQSGFIGGGQVGYNYLFRSNYLLGLEADIQGSDISGTDNINGIGLSAATLDRDGGTYQSEKYSSASIGQNNINGGVNWLGTTRARLGYLVTPTILIYGTGGLAYGGVYANSYSNALLITDRTLSSTSRTALYSTQQLSGGGRGSDTLVGYSAGGGFEWMTSSNWSIKAEALYYNLGNLNLATTNTSPATYDAAGFLKTPHLGQVIVAGNSSLNYQGLIARAGVNYHFNSLNSVDHKIEDGIFNAFSRTSSLSGSESKQIGKWDGFYIGMNSGYGFGTNNSTFITNNNITDPWAGHLVELTPGLKARSETTSGLASALSGILQMNQGGFIGGGQAGYNFKFQNFILGLETDIQGTSIRGSNATSGLGYSTAEDAAFRQYEETYSAASGGQTAIRAGLHWMGTVRGRLGYLWTPSFLTYGTAGLSYGGAYANVNSAATVQYSSSGNFIFTSRSGYEGGQQVFGGGSYTDTLVGYNVGGGFELLLNQNWSLKTEALYYNLGSMNISTNSFSPEMHSNNNPNLSFVPPRWIAGNTNVNFQGIIARVGINYHFDFGKEQRVIAKY